MKNVIIACEMLKNELDDVLRNNENKDDTEVIYISSQLHMNPAELNKEIQRNIDKLQNYENILVCCGSCGNSMKGIASKNTKLVLVKAHDCIDLLTLHNPEMAELRKNTYFFTKGWMDSPGNIMEEYEDTVAKYGENRAKEYFHMILSGYENVCLIDTGFFDSEKYSRRLEEAEGKFNLKSCRINGSLEVIEKLVNGNWDDDFIIKEKGEVVLPDDYLN